MIHSSSRKQEVSKEVVRAEQLPHRDVGGNITIKEAGADGIPVKLKEWWVPGFVDAEGCFGIYII